MCGPPPPTTSTATAAPEHPPMTLNLGDLAPDFTAETADGEIRFHEWLDESWGVLFSHPADFTPVCTTELGAVARLHDQFAARDTKVAAVSVDPAESHRAWAADIAETQGAEVNFPLIADPDRRVATLYGMIHPRHDDTATVRSVFVIGPDKRVKLTLTYPASTGRHFGEILRVLDSLQLTAAHQLATPADWQPGQDVIITPAVSHEEAARRFPDHRAIKPYLRLTAQPAPARPGDDRAATT
jgi:thioredoxin-dependent peroxiredoxin